MKKLAIAALAFATALSASPAFSQIYFEYAQDLATTMIHQRHGTIATRHATHTMTTMTTIAMANGAGHRNTTDTAMAIGWCDTGTFATRARRPASDLIIGGSGSGSISTMMSGVSFLANRPCGQWAMRNVSLTSPFAMQAAHLFSKGLQSVHSPPSPSEKRVVAGDSR